MRPPAFWFTDPDHPALAARLLAPLGWAYATATARRIKPSETFVRDVEAVCGTGAVLLK